MQKRIKIIGIGGSLEQNSYSLKILKYTLDEISTLGADISMFDIKEMKLPIFDYSGGRFETPDDFKHILDDIHSSHGLILSSPEYHGTVSASFKNFIDHLEALSSFDPPYLTRKPVGCIAIGGGENSGFFTLNTLVNIVHNLRGITPASNVAVPNVNQTFNDKLELTDENIKRRLKRLAGDVHFLASKLS